MSDDHKLTVQGPPMLGRCQFCKIDLGQPAADGFAGHVCSEKPADHAAGSFYEIETHADGNARHFDLGGALAARELLVRERDALRSALAEALGIAEHRVTWGGMPRDAQRDRIDLEDLAALRAKFLGVK